MREIVTFGDPVLQRRAEPVTVFDESLQALVADMFDAMKREHGLGLAAPQVNVPERVIVVELPADEEEGLPAELYAFVNPELVKASREKEEGQEGCLSIPGYVGDVERHVEVVVRGQDAYGRPQRLKAQDYLARILQHEMDHLEGVLFIDRTTKVHKITEEEASDPTPEVAEAMALLS